MKKLFSFFKWLAILLVVVVAALYISGNQHLIKGVYAVYLQGHKTASIDDAQFFDTRKVAIAQPQPWPTSENYNQKPLTEALENKLTEINSVAFLAVKNGEIVAENYWDGYIDTSHSNSFSMAKSIVTMLAQIAIQEGKIKSWDQKVIDFFPEFKGEFAQELTLRHLSTMTAGLSYNEHYTNPFDITARTYYGDDIAEIMHEEVGAIEKPGKWHYQSGATQWLAMVVMKATGMHLADYASKKLWQPLGAKEPAKWHLDHEEGTEIAFCCFNSNARDFARFGQMLLQNGKWNGQQILDSAFVAEASVGFAEPFYGHSFWINPSLNTKNFSMRGILGQYVIVLPEHDLVLVRLGHKRGEKINHQPTEIEVLVNESIKMFGQ